MPHGLLVLITLLISIEHCDTTRVHGLHRIVPVEFRVVLHESIIFF
jgi:hypothetical protein